jgi:hypothetical protein
MVALDLHRIIVQLTRNNRYFQQNQIVGDYDWSKMAEELSRTIIANLDNLQAESAPRNHCNTLFVPVAMGAGSQIPNMCDKLLKLNEKYESTSKYSADGAVSDAHDKPR